MLVGQWRHDLVGLDRKLRNQVDEASQDVVPTNGKGKQKSRPNGNNGSHPKETVTKPGTNSPGTKSQDNTIGFLF